MNTLKNIQKPIITGIVLVITVWTMHAQSGGGFGFKGGLNYGGHGNYFESISNNSENLDANMGYHLGIFGKIGNKIYFRPELVYTKTKSDYKSRAFDMSKLDLPLLIGIKVIGPLHIFGGSSFQYILNNDFEGLTIDTIENTFSVGLNFGIGINLRKIGLDLRYERGLSDNEASLIENNINISDRLDIRPKQLIVSLSVKI